MHIEERKESLETATLCRIKKAPKVKGLPAKAYRTGSRSNLARTEKSAAERVSSFRIGEYDQKGGKKADIYNASTDK